MTKPPINASRNAPWLRLTLLIGVGTLGCGDDPAGLAEGPTVVGTWTLDQSALAIDSAGGALASIDGLAGLSVPVVVASYVAEDTTFTIADLSGSQACDLGIVGQYAFSVTATSLVFGLVGDGCTGRRTFLTAGVWSRQPGR